MVRPETCFPSQWLLGLLVLAAVGCQTIASLREPSLPVFHGSAAQAEQARTNAWALYQQQPRRLPQVRQAADQLTAAARALPDHYDAQFQAAVAQAFLAEHAADKPTRLAAAKLGVVLARRARELQPDRPEGHYWYAVNTGLVADLDRAFGLSAVAEMEPALKRVIEVDEHYDYAGAHRLLGILYLRTPPPPTSIGSRRKGLRALQRASELFPEYPENQLYLAEALRETGRTADARTALEQVLRAKPWPDRQFESQRWRAQAQEQLAALNRQ
jgi:tetratricopeptide (TPR) repeat protein